MPPFSTPALILHHANYRDYDRMVTLFSPQHGRIEAVARGCRRPKSPLLNASEPFVSGEFMLYQRGERFTIEQCQITDGFFELREDYERLKHGVYWLKLLDASVLPDTPMPELFLTTLRALAHLCYSELAPELLTMAFEMHLMAQLGYAPRVDSCIQCNRPIDGDAQFDVLRGGCLCPNCGYGQTRIGNGARRVLLKLPRVKYDQVKLLENYPDWQEAATVFRSYIDDRLAIQKFAPPLPAKRT